MERILPESALCVKENKQAQIDHIKSFCISKYLKSFCKSCQEAFTQATGLEKSAALCVASDAAFLELSLQLFGLEKWNHGCCSRHLHLRHCMLVELLWDHRHFARASRIPRHHRYERCSATECRLNWPNQIHQIPPQTISRISHIYQASDIQSQINLQIDDSMIFQIFHV